MTRTPKAFAFAAALALITSPGLANEGNYNAIEQAMDAKGYQISSLLTPNVPGAPYTYEVAASKGGVAYDLFLDENYEIVLVVEK